MPNRPSDKGPGSNQHEDKPPVQPREATAAGGTLTAAAVLDDPFDETVPNRAPGAWIDDLDAHNEAAVRRAEQGVVDAEQARADAKAAYDRARAASAAAKSESADHYADHRVQMSELEREFMGTQRDVVGRLEEIARDQGVETNSHLLHEIVGKSMGNVHQFDGDGGFSAPPRPEQNMPRFEQWDEVAQIIEGSGLLAEGSEHHARMAEAAATAKPIVARQEELYQQVERAAQDAADAYKTFHRSADGIRAAKNRLHDTRRLAEKGEIPADSRQVEVTDRASLNRHVRTEPDGGTNAYVKRRDGYVRVVGFDRPEGKATAAGLGGSVSQREESVAVLADGSRWHGSSHRTIGGQYRGPSGPDRLVVAPPQPGSETATLPDGSQLGSMQRYSSSHSTH